MGLSRQEYWSGLPFPSPSADWHLQFKRQLMTAALRKGPGKVLQKWIPNTTDFQKPSFKGQFSSHPLTKKRNKEPRRPQDKMLSIANYYRNDTNQNDNKQSNPIWQHGHPKCLQTVYGGESQEIMKPPFMFPGTRHGQQPLEGTASIGQKKKFQDS